MKQKTPLLELLEWVNSKDKFSQFTHIEIVNKIIELLPKEKEVITGTYDDGYVNGMQEIKPSSLDYFNETFTQK